MTDQPVAPDDEAPDDYIPYPEGQPVAEPDFEDDSIGDDPLDDDDFMDVDDEEEEA